MSSSSIPMPLLPAEAATLTTGTSTSNSTSVSSFPTSQARTISNSSTAISISSTDAPMSIVAARKLALFQKINGGAGSITTPDTTSTPAPPSTSAFAPTNREWSDPSWRRRKYEGHDDVGPSPLENWRRRVSSVASQPPSGAFLTANLTGSTAVDDSAPRPIPSFPSVANRVKLAVMAFSQLDVNSDSKHGEIVRVGENGVRPWSRMSTSTSFTRADGSDATFIGDGSTNSTPFKRYEGSYFQDRSYSEAPSPTNLHRYLYPEDFNFDTHPPDMISPRTELAHVIAPPKSRPSSIYIRAAPTPLPPLEDHPDIQDDPEETEVEEITPVQMERPEAPISPTPNPIVRKAQTTVPKSPVLRTKDRSRPPRVSTSVLQTTKKVATRHRPSAPSISSQTTARTARVTRKTPSRCSTTPQQAAPAVPRPASVATSTTTIADRRMSVSIRHTTPINLKARNPHALRSDGRPPPLKPFITSARSWGPALVSGVVNRYADC